MGIGDREFPITRKDKKKDTTSERIEQASNRLLARQEGMRTQGKFWRSLGISPKQLKYTSYGMKRR